MNFTQKKCPNCGCGNFGFGDEMKMVCQDCGVVVE